MVLTLRHLIDALDDLKGCEVHVGLSGRAGSRRLSPAIDIRKARRRLPVACKAAQ
jgi:hypothetical protein